MEALRTRRLAWLAALALVTAGLVSGCGSGDDDSGSGGGGGGGGGDKPVVGVVAPYANPFQTDIKKGMQQAAKAAGVDLVYLNFNANSQNEAKYVQDLITRKVDLVLYGTNDAKVALTQFTRLKQAGIPIVCFDSCLEPDVQEQFAKAFVTSDNEQLGNSIAGSARKYIESKFNGKTQVAFVTCNTNAVCRARYDAQRKTLEGLDLDVAADQVAIEADDVKKVTEGILQAHPGVTTIITNGLNNTEGGVAAIRNVGKSTVLFGMDMTPVIGEDLLAKDSILQAVVGQDGIKIGETALKLGVDVLDNKPPAQFETQIPGTLYSRDDPAAVQQYLSAAG